MPEARRIPAAGSLGPIADSCVPKRGFLGPRQIADNVWIVRRLFSLGADQEEGLSYKGLRGRLLGLLGDRPLDHPALELDGESTRDQVAEERSRVADIMAGEFSPFPLDSTMTVVRTDDGRLTLHSVVPPDEELVDAIEALGEVKYLCVFACVCLCCIYE